MCNAFCKSPVAMTEPWWAGGFAEAPLQGELQGPSPSPRSVPGGRTGPLITQVASTPHFEAKHLVLPTAGLQSEFCLGVQLKYLLGSAAQKHGVGDFVCLLLYPGKPAPHKPRAWKQSVPSLLFENEPLQAAVYFIAAALGSEPIRSYAAMMCCVSGQHQTARRRMVPEA